MSHVVALVPIRSLSQGKTRLATHLNPSERLALSTQLLSTTLAALQAASSITECWVMSADTHVGVVAARYGATLLPELGADLNATLAQAMALLPTQVTHALILPIDLPGLTADLVDALVAHAVETDADLVIAPDRWELGTNALLVRQPFQVQPAFGPDSLVQHTAQARALGLRDVVYRAPAFAFDLDTPTDLAEYAQAHPLRRQVG